MKKRNKLECYEPEEMDDDFDCFEEFDDDEERDCDGSTDKELINNALIGGLTMAGIVVTAIALFAFIGYIAVSLFKKTKALIKS